MNINGKNKVAQKWEKERNDRMQAAMEGQIAAAPTKHVFPCYVGRKEDGEDVYFDLGARPHILLHGPTGSGKSNHINHFICSVLDRPNTLVYIADKRKELYGYRWHSSVRWACEDQTILQMVRHVAKKTEERSKFLLEKGIAERDEGRIFLIIDEFDGYYRGSEIGQLAEEIARKGRKYGIHILLATQGFGPEIFFRGTKNNFTSIAFRAHTEGEPLEKRIPVNRKGLAVFGGQFVQTPKASKGKYWKKTINTNFKAQ